MISIRPLTRIFALAACQIVLFGLASTSNASLTANAGADQSAGYDVPIILDATGSTGATTYFWQQTSGSPVLNIIGQDRAVPLIISAHNAGTYTFTLTVGDGITTDTDTMTVTIVAPAGIARYVDNTLSADTSTYSISNRNGSGSDGPGYKTLQSAANASQPGDTIYIRAGTFVNTGTILLDVTVSGTVTQPIRYQAYNGESVAFYGEGFTDADNNHDGYADGPANTTEKLIHVAHSANYVQFYGLEITNSARWGMQIESSFVYIEECSSHDNWKDAFDFVDQYAAPDNQQGIVFFHCEACRTRHENGFMLTHSETQDALTINNAFVECISYSNGYQADGNKVLPTNAGDPQGGGNSDGFSTEKFLRSPDGTEFYGYNNYWIRNVSYHNCDDNFDMTEKGCLLDGNYALNAGAPDGSQGVGIKVFDPTQDMVFRGNLIYSSNSNGIENRVLSGHSNNFYNNTVISNGIGIAGGKGISYVDANAIAKNNLCAFNVGTDFNSSVSPPSGHNWAEDGGSVESGYSGDPKLSSNSMTLDLGFSAGWTVAQKWAFLRTQVETAFTPLPISHLINAGFVIDGYDCPTADDDPVTPADPSDPRRHWFGSTPDIGAFEYDPNSPKAPQHLRIE